MRNRKNAAKQIKKALCTLAAGALFSNFASAATVQVKIEGMNFVPETVQAKAGDTIEWTNADLVPHTVTSASKHGTAWDSGVIAPGKTFQRKFPEAGSLPYKCTLHPTMKGKIMIDR